jgi:hypothetical protein
MTRLTPVLLLGLLMLVSVSAQAGHRGGHYNKHNNGHYNKYNNGHHNKHQRRYDHYYGGHYYAYGHRPNGYRHYSNYGYGGITRPYFVPHVAQGTHYGYAADGTVIVYQTYPYRDYRY